jgi:hypothetical protein
MSGRREVKQGGVAIVDFSMNGGSVNHGGHEIARTKHNNRMQKPSHRHRHYYRGIVPEARWLG